MTSKQPRKTPDADGFDPTRFIPSRQFNVPDLSAAVEGWRVWKLDATKPLYGNPPRLYSVTMGGYYWQPRQIAEASCQRCGEDLPGQYCACGFYSAKTFEHLMTMRYHTYDPGEPDRPGDYRVLGKVANWGNVVPGTQGWRAQFSYPVKLWVPFEAWRFAKLLRDTYRVPVGVKNVYDRYKHPETGESVNPWHAHAEEA